MRKLTRCAVFLLTFACGLGAAHAQTQDQSSEDGLVFTFCGPPRPAMLNNRCPTDYAKSKSDEMDCDADQCCGLSGKVNYDARISVVNGTYYDIKEAAPDWPITPAGTGRCVRGLANGKWTSQLYKNLNDSEDEYAPPEYKLFAVAKGTYQFGLPVGGHTVSADGVIVQAACYQRKRVVEDGKVSYVSQKLWHLPNEPCYAYDSGDELSEPAKPVRKDYLPKLDKPVLTDFQTITEKPELETVEKPNRDDYYSAAAYREALQDHQLELKAAREAFREAKISYKEDLKTSKAALREAQQVYQERYKEMLPESERAFKQALAEYRTETKRYKARKKELRAYGRTLKRLAAACPRIPDAYCDATGECATEARCTYRMKPKNSEEDDAYQAGYDEELPGMCVLSSSAHCRKSDLCKVEGRCHFEKNDEIEEAACIAKHPRDCEKSQGCTSEGLCTVDPIESTCVNGCESSCREKGECKWRRRTGQICEPTTDQDCEKSVGCTENGYCSRQMCTQRGGCSLAGQKVFRGSYVCAAVTDAHCQASAMCLKEGLCSADKKTGLCIAADNQSCAASEACGSRCSAVDGRCVIGSHSDCQKTLACATQGRCTFKDGVCVGPAEGAENKVVPKDAVEKGTPPSSAKSSSKAKSGAENTPKPKQK